MPTLPPTPWLAQIESAHSVADLVRTLRDYLASLGADEVAQLPAEMKASSLHAAADIQEWAVTLAQHDLRSGADAPPVLHRSAVVFAAAGAKLPRLAA